MFQESTNQQQELSVLALFVNGSVHIEHIEINKYANNNIWCATMGDDIYGVHLADPAVYCDTSSNDS